MKTSTAKILIVDDEEDILDFLEHSFTKQGFQIIKANSGQQAIDLARKENPDLVLLDLLMPDMDGVEVCQELRSLPAFKQTLIVFLSARTEDYSRIAAFQSGADGYITKPIRIRVLIEEVKAFLKRINTKRVETTIHEVGDLKIDFEKRIIFQNQRRVELTKREFDLFTVLSMHPEKVFTREEVYRMVWGTEISNGDRIIDVYIRKLRQKFGQNCIRSIKGVGYKFVA